MSLSIVLNGQTRTFTSLVEQASLAKLVAELQLKGDRVAIELNGVIVERTRWPETLLASGDRLEVVHFVGGGCGQGHKVDREAARTQAQPAAHAHP